MDFMQAFEISSSGMNVEKLRLETVAQNIANANSSAQPGNGVYQSLRVVSAPKTQFSTTMRELMAGAEIKAVTPEAVNPRLVFEPNHPHANEKGFVAYPNINPVTEMLQLIAASRAYEANVEVFNAAKSMALRALEIGGESS